MRKDFERMKRTQLLLLVLIVTSPCIARAQFGGGGGGLPGPPSGATPDGPQKSRRYSPARFAPQNQQPVAQVRLTGQFTASESRIRGKLQTRAGRTYDPDSVRADVRHLLASGLCYDVKTYREDTPQGIVVTFELFQQPTVQYIKFQGASIGEKKLLKKCELAMGEPLSRYTVEEARRRLLDFYLERGNSKVQIEVAEGLNREDRGIVFQIDEGPRQRIFRTNIVGNTIVSSARLKTQIASKPGILWIFKGQVDEDVIAEDIDKLTSYYRSLGFFKAKVTHQMQFDDDQEWLSLTFQVDEGPRYVIRQIGVEGNAVFEESQLLTETKLRPGEFFDLTKLNQDVAVIDDIYGINGYVMADVQAEPQFFEQPGQLDIIYKVSEGTPYVVGDIEINIKGEFPHTRQEVVWNRINLRPGDILDVRKLRNSKRRIQSSQLFENGPMSGPEINVRPRDQIAQPPRDIR